VSRLPGLESGRIGERSAADRSFSFVSFRGGERRISKRSPALLDIRSILSSKANQFRHLNPPKQVVNATSCAICSPPTGGRVSMARKVGQIIRRGTRTWLVRVYCGRDVETKKRKYLNQTIHGGLRDAQAPFWGIVAAGVIVKVSCCSPRCAKPKGATARKASRKFGADANHLRTSLRLTVIPLMGLSSPSRKRAQKSVAPPPLTTAARTMFGPFWSVIRLDTPSSITVWRSP